jgi:elongation factor G
VGSAHPTAVYAGINEMFEKNGDLADHRCENTLIRVIDGSYHDVDSKDSSYKNAAKIAFRKALDQSGLITDN